MTVKTERFVRKPFFIDAVQVTSENADEVAKWCQGDVRKDTGPVKPQSETYVKVRVHRPLNERQTKAYVGDWVLYAGSGFKVYTLKAFDNSFEIVDKPEDSPGDVLFMLPGSDRVEELFVTAEQV